MPFILTSYNTDNATQDAANASKLSERFRRLASATDGEVKIHKAETANGFVIEYNSKDITRDNARLGATLKDLITTFAGEAIEDITVQDIKSFAVHPATQSELDEPKSPNVVPRRAMRL